MVLAHHERPAEFVAGLLHEQGPFRGGPSCNDRGLVGLGGRRPLARGPAGLADFHPGIGRIAALRKPLHELGEGGGGVGTLAGERVNDAEFEEHPVRGCERRPLLEELLIGRRGLGIFLLAGEAEPLKQPRLTGRGLVELQFLVRRRLQEPLGVGESAREITRPLPHVGAGEERGGRGGGVGIRGDALGPCLERLG